MKIKCVHYDVVKDKNNGFIYEPNKIYEMLDEERKNELVASGYFVEVKDEITETEVQAVANAIVEQANETGETVEQVVTEIVNEGNEEETKAEDETNTTDEAWVVTNEEDGVHVRPVVDGEIIDTPVEKVVTKEELINEMGNVEIDLEALKVDELKQIAKDMEIENYNSMKKAELIEAISKPE